MSNNILNELIAKAQDRFPGWTIVPCGKKQNLSECITKEEIRSKTIYMLWYNIDNYYNDDKSATFAEQIIK